MKTWTQSEIKSELQAGNKVLLQRALMAIYEGQTSSEKLAMTTTDLNGIGFNGVDAGILTSFAEQFRSKGWLSPKQMALLQKKMPKYAGQLFRIYEAKNAPKVEQKPEPKSFCVELSEAQWNGERVCFENGAEIDLDDMTPIMQEGEACGWELHINGNHYLIVND